MRDGDLVTLDVDARRIDMAVSDEEIARRRTEWQRPIPKFSRGYGVMFLKHVQQADSGCDFDFLAPDYVEPTAPDGQGAETARAVPAGRGEPDIH